MKPKNLALMGVAIACGLLAAFVTARLGANSATPNTIEVPVFIAEVKQGTRMSEPEKLFYKKRIQQDLVPADAVVDLGTIKGKFLYRNQRKDSFLSMRDVTSTGSVDLPAGHQGQGIRVDAAMMAGGLVLPGTKVDVIWLPKVKKKVRDPDFNRVEWRDVILSKRLLQNQLVVAVDAGIARPETDGGTAGIKNPGVVTIAVTPADGEKLALAERAGELKLALRAPGDEARSDDLSVKEIIDLITVGIDDGTAAAPGGKVPVAIKDIPANTKIELFEEFFEMRQVNPKPANACENEKDLLNKYITKAVYAEQHVPRSVVSDSPVEEKKEVQIVERVVEKVKDAPRPSNAHLMVIQDGLKKPQTVIYENGRANPDGVTPEGLKKPGAPADPVPEESVPAPGSK
jgi:pilus assembly protein CpaB